MDAEDAELAFKKMQPLVFWEPANLVAAAKILERCATRACVLQGISIAEHVTSVLARVARRDGIVGWVRSGWYENPRAEELGFKGRLIPSSDPALVPIATLPGALRDLLRVGTARLQKSWSAELDQALLVGQEPIFTRVWR